MSYGGGSTPSGMKMASYKSPPTCNTHEGTFFEKLHYLTFATVYMFKPMISA